MADASGLDAQQRIAAEIPYKNIALGNPGEMFLNAWALASQIKLKRAEIEGKMQALAERNRQLEISSELKEQEHAIRMAAVEQNAGFKADSANRAWEMMGLREQEQRNKNTLADLAVQKYQDNEDAQTGLATIQSDLDNEGYERGTLEWQNEYNHRASPLLGKLGRSSFNAQQRLINTNQAQATFQRQRNNEMEMKEFRERVGAELYNNPGVQGLNAIVDPESLPPATKKVPSPVFGSMWPKTVPDPSKKLVPTLDISGQKIVGKPTDIKKLMEFNKEYQALLDKQKHTAKPVNTYSNDPVIQQARDAISAAKNKGQDITDQVRERLIRMGKNPDDL